MMIRSTPCAVTVQLELPLEPTQPPRRRTPLPPGARGGRARAPAPDATSTCRKADEESTVPDDGNRRVLRGGGRQLDAATRALGQRGVEAARAKLDGPLPGPGQARSGHCRVDPGRDGRAA
ncbi:MAG: hypothetical protein ACYDDZ_07395 [Acidimicrobiales bacterium]